MHPTLDFQLLALILTLLPHLTLTSAIPSARPSPDWLLDPGFPSAPLPSNPKQEGSTDLYANAAHAALYAGVEGVDWHYAEMGKMRYEDIFPEEEGEEVDVLGGGREMQRSEEKGKYYWKEEERDGETVYVRDIVVPKGVEEVHIRKKGEL